MYVTIIYWPVVRGQKIIIGASFGIRRLILKKWVFIEVPIWPSATFVRTSCRDCYLGPAEQGVVCVDFGVVDAARRLGKLRLGHRDALAREHALVDDAGADQKHGVAEDVAALWRHAKHVSRHQLSGLQLDATPITQRRHLPRRRHRIVEAALVLPTERTTLTFPSENTVTLEQHILDSLTQLNSGINTMKYVIFLCRKWAGLTKGNSGWSIWSHRSKGGSSLGLGFCLHHF